MSLDLWITSNSPGEVSRWVGGVVPELRRLRPRGCYRLMLVPCPYASGAEKRVALTIPGLDEVCSPWETTLWFFGLQASRLPRAGKGAVLFLGGDPWHALLLGRKLRLPVLGYFEKRSPWMRFFQGVALAYEGDRTTPRDFYAGNLMVDSAPPRENCLPRACRIGLFPGSRPWQARLTLGPMLQIAQELSQRLAGKVEFEVVQSPFLEDSALDRALQSPFPLGLPTAQGRLEPGSIRLSSGLEVSRVPGGGGLSGLDLAITIPGTNTAELACAGIPFVVILHPLAFIGGGGLSGLIERLPLPNAWKSSLRRRKHRRLRFTALPNQKADFALVPEVILERSLEPVCSILQGWVEEPLEQERMRQRILGIMGEPGACRRLARWTIETLETTVG